MYDLIYADPPWRYEHCASNSRKIENKYPTMNLDEIKNLKFECEDNAMLFMWTTAPKLEESLEVMRSWGFVYRSCAIWDKGSIGMGYYFRIQHEILLIGMKGKVKTPLPKNRISSILKFKKTKHSAKPLYIYTLLERMYPDAKKLELFSRYKREGWDCWGNQVPKETQNILRTI